MFRRLLVVTAVALSTTVFVSNASAAEERADNLAVLSPALIATAPLASAPPFSARMPVAPALRTHARVGANVGMSAIYASTILMHVLDVDSTLKALKVGAIEANPLMSGVVHNKAAFVATKVAIAGASLYATHRMARNNRVAAVIASTAINSAYLMVVRNNYRMASR